MKRVARTHRPSAADDWRIVRQSTALGSQDALAIDPRLDDRPMTSLGLGIGSIVSYPCFSWGPSIPRIPPLMDESQNWEVVIIKFKRGNSVKQNIDAVIIRRTEGDRFEHWWRRSKLLSRCQRMFRRYLCQPHRG